MSTGLGICLCLCLCYLMIADSFSFCGPQFGAVHEEHLNQIALRLDGRALFDNEQGHQSVRKQEQDCEQREKASLLLWSRNRHHRRVTEKSIQVAPRPSLNRCRHRADFSLSANGADRFRPLNLFGLARSSEGDFSAPSATQCTY